MNAGETPEQLRLRLRRERYHRLKTDPLEQEKRRVHARRSYKKNRAKQIAAAAAWTRAHPERRNATRRAFYQVNREQILADLKTEEARAKARCVYKQRAARDPQFVLKRRLSARLWQALKRSRARKDLTTMDLVGCSRVELMGHIERQFLPGMSWDNVADWHVDHIRPVCSFDLTDPVQQAACFHFSNLRPLWPTANRAKAGKWNPP